MRIGLFIPCYINQFYPEVGIATLELLEKLKVEVEVPMGQTCCGQPMANSGYENFSKQTCQKLVSEFKGYDYIVTPSGSCAYHVKKHYDILAQSKEVIQVRNNIYELSDFLVNVLKISRVGAFFNRRVGIHKSCHGLRGLRLGASSERVEPSFSVMETLLEQVEGIELMEVSRPDECCGFGGTFAIAEEAVSVKMGKDKIRDHLDSGVQVITGTDTSCLMHLDGLINRNHQPIRVMHIAEILNHQKS